MSGFNKAVLVTVLLLLVPFSSMSQLRWGVGGNMGLAISTSPSSADFTFGPQVELMFGKEMAVGTEFNFITSSSFAVEWADYFKYYFSIPGSKVKPYANVGFGLLFVSGGPYFDVRFGGGASFEVARNLFVSPDLQLGPVFITGNTQFLIVIRGGIRYELQ